MNFSIPVREGLELRLRTQSDTEAFFEVIDRNRIYLRKWLPWLDESATVHDVREYITSELKLFQKKEGLDLGIWHHGQWVGGIGFHGWGGKSRETTIGYWLSEDAQGNGIMTDSVRALVAYGFKTMNLNRIAIRCATGNAKSRAIPIRLGFKREGILRQAEWLHDHFVDLVIYSRLAEEGIH